MSAPTRPGEGGPGAGRSVASSSMPVASDLRTRPADEAPHQRVDRPSWGRLLTRRPVPGWVVAVLVALLALPLLVALVALRRPTWFPVLDLAMTELRVRDVGTRDTPLIGLPGRIGTLEEQGSHPGPLSFYLLAPTYRLLGSSAWALQAAAVVLNVAAMATALLIVRVRGGLRAVLGVAAILATLNLAYGLSVLTEPWNPYMPLLWWVVFLLAAWSVSLGDWRVLPVAAFAATLCAQTHLPYLGLCGVIGVGALAVGLMTTWRDVDRRRAGIRWMLVAAAVVAVLWSPLVVDEVTRDPGNITQLREHMFEPPDEPVGYRTGARVILVHLDLTQVFGAADGGSGSLVDTSYDPYGSVVPGLVLLGLWGVTVALALRARLWAIVRLHAIVAVGLVLGVVSTGRVFGKLWYYLTLWAWSLGVLAAGAAVWTVATVLARRDSGTSDGAGRPRSYAALAAAVLVLVGVLTVQAPDVEPPAARLSAGLGAVLDDTETAVRDGVGAATGPEGRYAVSWTDGLHIGSQGYGVVSELERRGLVVGGMPWARVPLTEHRVIDPSEATAVLHFATGIFVDQWRARPEAVEVATADPRTAAERDEFEGLRTQVIADLEATGLDDVVPLVDGNLFGASLDPRLDDATHERMGRMLDLGIPISVFIAPPDVSTLQG